MEKVSIVIPCYNAERFVGKAIRSALNQTYEPKEVIVVDDGSTDGSLEAIRAYSTQITLRSGENHGAATARNRGLRLAEGAFVKFLDADDWLAEDAIKLQVTHSRTLPSKSVVYGNMVYVEEKSRRHFFPFPGCAEEHKDQIAFLMKNNIATPSPLHRRDYLLEVGGFDESLSRGQEYDLHIRLVLNGVRFHYHETTVCYVRVHDGGDRISNRRIDCTRLMKDLARIERQWERISEARNGKVSDDIKQIIARSAWRNGRVAVRMGCIDLAEQYFDYASVRHDKCITTDSKIYHWCVCIVGPIITERAREWIRKTKDKIQTFYD